MCERKLCAYTIPPKMKGSLLEVSFLISSEIVALVPLNMVVTKKGRGRKSPNQTYQKKCPASHKSPMTKPVLQWVIRCSNVLLLRTEPAKGFQAHTVI